jgi:haloalkane dehalogenase
VTGGDPFAWVDREAYPFRSRWRDLPGGRMHYVDEGAGEPVVLVHGTPEWSFGWRHLVRALSPARRCLAMDHLGFGLSDKPPDGRYGPEDHAARLAALLDPLDLRQATLVVHDFGVPIGLAWALDHPDRVARLVVLNGWLWSLAGDPGVRRVMRVMAGPLGRWLYLYLNLSPRVLLPYAFGDRSRLSPAVHAQYLAPFPRPRDRHGPWGLARAVLGSSAWYAALEARRDRLAAKPALLLWGLADPAFRPHHLARWRAALPGAEVVALPGVGHFPQEEAAGDVVGRVRAFLDRPAPPACGRGAA